jgi:hypothetical protein
LTSENTLTGRNGKFVIDTSLVARVTQWTVNPTLATSNEWGDSDSAGYTNRSSGRRDATFDTEGKYDITDEVFDIFHPEDITIATLWMDATSLYWDFPRALCTDFNLTVNVDSEEVIGWTASHGADGIFYRPGQAGIPARTLP